MCLSVCMSASVFGCAYVCTCLHVCVSIHVSVSLRVGELACASWILSKLSMSKVY